MNFYDELTLVEANRNIIPSSNIMTFSEQSLYVAEYAFDEFTKLCKSIGIEELCVYESTGDVIIYEGEKLNAFKDKVKEFFKKIWAAIKAAYDKIIDFFETKIKEAKEKLSSKLFLSKIDKLVDKKDGFGKVHEYKLENIQSDVIEVAQDLRDKIEDNVDKFISKITLNTSVKDISESSKELVDKCRNIIDNSFGGNDKKNIKNLFMDDKVVTVTKKWLEENGKDVCDIVVGGAHKREISKAYKAEKDNLDKATKDLNNLTKYQDAAITASNPVLKIYTYLTTKLHTVCNAYADVMKKRYHEYLIIMTRVIFSKTEKEEK